MDFDKILQQLASFGTEWGIKIVGVLIGLLVALWIAGWVRDRIQSTLEKRDFDPTLSRFFAAMARYGILVGAVLGLLGVFGIQTASFAAVIAAGGLAIGLSFQGTLANFAAGVMLLVFRPFKVEELITVAGHTGVVQAIGLFTVELKTPDNKMIIVPNKNVFGANIENYSHHPIRRVDVPVGVDYSADIDKTIEVLTKAADSVEGALKDPAPQIFLKELGGSSVDYQVRVWCNSPDYWGIWQATTRATKMHLDEAGLGIPFPQMDVHFDSPAPAAPKGVAMPPLAK